MKHAKSKFPSKRNGSENVFIQMYDLWKTDVNWDGYSPKEKRIIIWFGLSFVAMIILSCTWLFFPAAINFGCSLGCMKHIDVKE